MHKALYCSMFIIAKFTNNKKLPINLFHTIKYDMTKKQVRKLSLEHRNMALNVKRKPKTVPRLALKDSNRVCLYTRTKHLQESSSTGYSGTGNES